MIQNCQFELGFLRRCRYFWLRAILSGCGCDSLMCFRTSPRVQWLRQSMTTVLLYFRYFSHTKTSLTKLSILRWYNFCLLIIFSTFSQWMPLQVIEDSSQFLKLSSNELCLICSVNCFRSQGRRRQQQISWVMTVNAWMMSLLMVIRKNYLSDYSNWERKSSRCCCRERRVSSAISSLETGVVVSELQA